MSGSGAAMATARRASLTVILLVGALAPAPLFGQISGPPVGGRSGNYIGPPTGTVQDFLGTWNFSWAGPIDSKCPCRGTIAIELGEPDDGSRLVGHWKLNGRDTVLRGSVSYDRNAWAGRFEQFDDTSDFPLHGFFRMEVRDANTLAGSYQPEGTAVPFYLSGTRN
jgi:hypothetical protein